MLTSFFTLRLLSKYAGAFSPHFRHECVDNLAVVVSGNRSLAFKCLTRSCFSATPTPSEIHSAKACASARLRSRSRDGKMENVACFQLNRSRFSIMRQCSQPRLSLQSSARPQTDRLIADRQPLPECRAGSNTCGKRRKTRYRFVQNWCDAKKTFSSFLSSNIYLSARPMVS